jgi:hypothetical protein
VLPLTYQLEILSSLSAPFFKIGSITSPAALAGKFPYGAFSLLSVKTLNQVYIEPHPHRNYVMQWNFSVQQQLAGNLTMLVSYVGSRGVHQPFRSDDINIVLPEKTPQGYLWPSPAGSGTLLNPNAGTIRAIMWEGITSYHSLQTQVTKRMSRGFQVPGSYNWGKSIDNSSATLVGDAFGNSIPSLHWFDTKLSRGLSDFNVAHTAVVNAIWQIPASRISGPAAWAINGWELGGIYKINTGVPFTAILGGDPLGLNSSDPYAFPNRLNTPACASLVNPGNPNNYVKAQCFSFPNPQTLRGNEGATS